jgi:hypothetical protein
MGTFSNHAPGSTFGFGTPLLSQPILGPIRAGSGDRIYSFGSSPVYSIDTSTSFVVKGFVLQMKQFRTEGGPLSDFFAPTLNGISADYVMTDYFVENVAGIDEPQSVTTWFWGPSLASQTITDLDIQIADQGAGHYSVDAITIDAGTVSVIPEPTAVSLLGGAGLLFLMRRRRGPVSLGS